METDVRRGGGGELGSGRKRVPRQALGMSDGADPATPLALRDHLGGTDRPPYCQRQPGPDSLVQWCQSQIHSGDNMTWTASRANVDIY